jgi:hypothetical protein
MTAFPGWTPDDVRRLTLQELAALRCEIRKHREAVPPLDVTCELIRRVLFAFLGAKESEPVEKQMQKMAQAGMKTAKVPEGVFKAWEKSGYKGTLNDFMKRQAK